MRARDRQLQLQLLQDFLDDSLYRGWKTSDPTSQVRSYEIAFAVFPTGYCLVTSLRIYTFSSVTRKIINKESIKFYFSCKYKWRRSVTVNGYFEIMFGMVYWVVPIWSRAKNVHFVKNTTLKRTASMWLLVSLASIWKSLANILT